MGAIIINKGSGGSTLPLTTRGDLLTRDSSTNIRLGIGSNGQVLMSNGTDPSWQNPDFLASLFRVSDPSDTTKKFALSLASVGSGVTRTWTVQNLNGTPALLDQVQTINGAWTLQGPSVGVAIKADATGLAFHCWINTGTTGNALPSVNLHRAYVESDI